MKCGKDLNEGECGCDTFVPDPRMAVFQDIFKANKVGRVVMIADGKISTEKIMKESYKDRMNELTTDGFSSDDSHEEFSILDKANRVQISPDMLAAAGIDSNKVKVQVVDGKVIITKE